MAEKVAGEMYETITGQLFEIGRQLRQPKGYPFNPEDLKNHLQAGIEGKFVSTEVSVAHIIVDPDAPLDDDKTKDGWEYLSDVKEPTGELALELVEFLKEGETFIKGEELVKRAKEKHILLGQRHAEALLKNQGAIPREWRKYYLVFPGSVLQGPDGLRCVPYLYCVGSRWCLVFHWLGYDFYFCDRLVGSRK